MMRRRTWLIGIGLLGAVFLTTCTIFRHHVYPSFGYSVEARFDVMPPNDKALIDWLKSQPGVVGGMGVNRFEEDQKLLQIIFTMSQNFAGEPPFPNLDGIVPTLGYSGADGPFRDSVGRQGWTIQMK
jgi:hypothetical protein